MYTYNTAPPADELARAQNELAQVKDIMVQNVEQILSRGERIELLVDKTDNMASQATAFRRGAKTVRRQMWWRNKRVVALGFVVALVSTQPKPVAASGKESAHHAPSGHSLGHRRAVLRRRPESVRGQQGPRRRAPLICLLVPCLSSSPRAVVPIRIGILPPRPSAVTTISREALIPHAPPSFLNQATRFVSVSRVCTGSSCLSKSSFAASPSRSPKNALWSRYSAGVRYAAPVLVLVLVPERGGAWRPRGCCEPRRGLESRQASHPWRAVCMCARALSYNFWGRKKEERGVFQSEGVLTRSSEDRGVRTCT
ncbi:hypothetical protein EVG20_g5917 [Dentipellis fragilis]|uniref:V-SNARE coiled-coil homology domain-containing protein n=1 Tax=Dentipellis fragilis TaxID=205917 RepID=A0A4Y9YS66_9AGAM|nr:hypothetical protein EVG20_g5917 [Dentipellis fragilis]